MRTRQYLALAVIALAVLAIGVHAKKKKVKADETITHKVRCQEARLQLLVISKRGLLLTTREPPCLPCCTAAGVL